MCHSHNLHFLFYFENISCLVVPLLYTVHSVIVSPCASPYISLTPSLHQSVCSLFVWTCLEPLCWIWSLNLPFPEPSHQMSDFGSGLPASQLWTSGLMIIGFGFCIVDLELLLSVSLPLSNFWTWIWICGFWIEDLVFPLHFHCSYYHIQGEMITSSDSASPHYSWA